MQIGVVIPLYRQAQFLVDSVTSALGQSFDQTAVVIVNDGCPDPLSHQLGTAFAASYPDQVVYVRQKNAGLSAARNCGIRTAINRWPSLEAIFFLDADNILEPEALETLLPCLKAADNIGWVYTPQARFGTEHVIWDQAKPANLFRMLFESQCDAGSLVRRAVFDNGIYFDETMREGYEDWEFFIRILRFGYTGVKSSETELLYRVKQHSMLIESQSKHEALVAGIQQRHQDIMEPRSLTEIEHAHSPRFLWVSPDGEMISSFTDPEEARTSGQSNERDTYWPPVILFGTREVWQYLSDLRILRSVLLLAQAKVPRSPVAFVFESSKATLEITDGRGGSALPHLLCFYHQQIKNSDANSVPYYLRLSQRLAINVPLAAANCMPSPLTEDLISDALQLTCDRGVFGAASRAPSNKVVQIPTSQFAGHRQCVQLETTYPLIDKTNLHICFAAPWLKLGGVDHCILQLARAFRRLVPTARLHLVTTQGGLAVGKENATLFDNLIFLSDLEWDQKTRLCDSIFQSMDLVINAHSDAAYESLRWRLRRPKQQRTGVHLPYLHVMDEAKGRLVGFPWKAVEVEHSVDGFVVISNNLRNFLVNQGVSPYRIRLARNASVVAPPSKEAALELLKQKSERHPSGAPIKLLFAGRADYQKGITRLKLLADELLATGVPFELTFVGGSVLQAERVTWPKEVVRLMPATHDEEQLASYYAEADIFVLLSRWEGVPLSLLDAMAHGCIVIATDVGAVSELIDDGRNGFLVPNGVDSDVASQAAAIIRDVLKDNACLASLRKEAIEVAWSHSWDNAAKVFLSFLPEQAKTRYCPTCH